LIARCEKLTETVEVLAERARTLEKSQEEADKDRLECERLRHELSVLVASEEKLVDKINDKDDATRRLLDELSECKRSLEEQSHKLQMANIALDTYKDDGSRCSRELDDSRARQKELVESEKQLAARVRDLEMTEAVLTTKLTAAEADREHLFRAEEDLKREVEGRRQAEQELLEKIAGLETRKSSLHEKVERLEARATHLVEMLRNAQQMSLQQQLRAVFDADNDDDKDVVQPSPVFPDSTNGTEAPEDDASGYDLERLSKVDLLSKVYQLERKCLLQRNKIRDLSNELSSFRQTVAKESNRQMDTVLPVLMSTVENKVKIYRNCSEL